MVQNFDGYFVYIMTNYTRTVLYIGVTNNLLRRVYEHKNKMIVGFTVRYNIVDLVYYEQYSDINEALLREKQLKAGSRKKKLNLILKFNPSSKDLYEALF